MGEAGKNLPEENELFKQLKKQLDDIELREILDGISEDDLAEKGYTGSKPIQINRCSHNRHLQNEQVVLEEDIEFMRLPDDSIWDEINIETLQGIADIECGTKVAVGSLKCKNTAGVNIECKEVESQLVFTSKIRGKLVIFNRVLNIFPSDKDCVIEITVTENKLRATMCCSAAFGKGRQLTIREVKAVLEKMNVSRGILEENIVNAVNDANFNNTCQKDIVVAEGTSPIHGKDGYVDFRFDLNRQNFDFAILPDGRIDYRNSANILMAKDGQLLARIIDPDAGTGGYDVFNKEVAAEPGAPVNLLAGKGVTVKDKEFFASCSGSIVLNGSVLEIADTYVVKGDVDFATGNISFCGMVIITGNVLDGFEVKADGDIVVVKNVESARLEAGRDIIVKGGVLGKGKGLISAGRDIYAEYVQNGRLEAQGSVEIGNFSINSYIATTNNLRVIQKRGVLIGGEVYALRGVDAKTIGSEQGVKTFVEVGNDFLIQKKINEFKEIILKMTANLKKIDDTLRTVATAIKNNSQLKVSRQPLIKKAFEKRNEINKNLQIVQCKCEDLKKYSQFKDECFVKVAATCHSDVLIKIRSTQTFVSKARYNVRFYEDTQADRIGCKFY